MAIENVLQIILEVITIRILSLDQSTNVTGYALFEDNKLIVYGRVDISKQKDSAKRIDAMRDWASDLIDDYQPDFVVLEQTFLNNFKGKAVGVDVYALLNKNLGVLENMILRKGISYEIVYPKTWKSVMKIKGRGRKEQKANTMLKMYEIFGRQMTEDEADACGIGAYACMNKSWEKIGQ